MSNPSARNLVTGEPLRWEILRGAAITSAGLAAPGETVTPATEAAVFRFAPVAPGGSTRIRMYETYVDSARYRLVGDELVWERVHRCGPRPAPGAPELGGCNTMGVSHHTSIRVSAAGLHNATRSPLGRWAEAQRARTLSGRTAAWRRDMRDGGWRMTDRPRLRDMLVLVALTPVWWLVTSASTFEKGFLAWCVAAAFYVVSELWGFRRKARFWAAIVLFALVYMVGLWAVRVPESLATVRVVTAGTRTLPRPARKPKRPPACVMANEAL